MKFKTYTATASDLSTKWYLVDATGQTMGRLASCIAKVLKGKHRPIYTPHLNCGENVIVINAAKMVVTGSKMDSKVYTRYTGYPGGLRSRTMRQAIQRDPTFPLRHAVEGMLQHNKLGADMAKGLRVYAGPEHGHQAQRPVPISFDERGGIRIGDAG